jgi:hypothetical protein
VIRDDADIEPDAVAPPPPPAVDVPPAPVVGGRLSAWVRRTLDRLRKKS